MALVENTYSTDVLLDVETAPGQEAEKTPAPEQEENSDLQSTPTSETEGEAMVHVPRVNSSLPVPGLAAAASHVARSRPNEDAFQVGERVGERGIAWPYIVLADGVGSASHGGVAARCAAEATANFLSTAAGDDPCLIRQVLQRAVLAAKDALIAAAVGAEGRDYSATLLIAMETPDWIGIAYLGDGAIFHAPTEYVLSNEQDSSNMVWAWRNLLSPHLAVHDENEGRLVLDRYVDGTPHYLPRPTIQLLAKEECGDVIILCTDGVASANDAKMFQYVDEDGREAPLRSISGGLLALSEMLSELWQESEAPDAPQLHTRLSDLLPQLRSSVFAGDDDATAGVLLTHAGIRERWASAPVPVRRDQPIVKIPVSLPTPVHDVPVKAETNTGTTIAPSPEMPAQVSTPVDETVTEAAALLPQEAVEGLKTLLEETRESKPKKTQQPRIALSVRWHAMIARVWQVFKDSGRNLAQCWHNLVQWWNNQYPAGDDAR